MSTHRRHPYACLREIGFLFPEELEFSFYFLSVFSSIIHSFNFFLNFSPNLSSTLSSTSLLNSSATISKFSFLEQARYLDYPDERSLPGILQASFHSQVLLPGLFRRALVTWLSPGELFPFCLVSWTVQASVLIHFWWLNPSFLTLTFLMFSSVSSLLFPSSEKDSGQSLKPRHYKFP